MSLMKSARLRIASLFVALAFGLVGMAAPSLATPKYSAAVADAVLTTLKAKPNSGTLTIYSGTQPTDPDTALSGNTALATFTFSSTACGSNSTSGGYKVCTLSFASSSVTASATGTATFARIKESDGTTADIDLTVGTSGADINMSTTSFVSGGTISLTSVLLRVKIG